MTEIIELALKSLESQLNQPLEAALEACARCGICAEACHYYRAEPKLEHIPAYRAEQLRSVYRYEHDFLSRLFPVWTRSKKLDETTLAKLTEIAFSQCTICRRCTVNCPLGVDTPLTMRAIRAMASAAGTAPEILVMLADAAIEKGKDPSFYKELFLDQIKEMEEQLRDITGNPNASIPVEKQGAKILYVPLAGAHTILPPAIVFNAAKEDWTLSIFEAANYGVFLADTKRAKEVAKRIVDEANRLGVKEIVVAECGHAYASYRWDVPNWFAGEFNFKVRSLIEVIADYIQEGKIQVDPTAIPETVTYHDSCNLARNGGLIEEPRFVLKNIVSDFREMAPNKAEALCCGGGGGLVALDEYAERRIAAGKPKAEQIRNTGANVVVAACENCRLQIGDLNEHYNLNVRITALTDLVVRAMRLPKSLPGAEAETLFEGEKADVTNDWAFIHLTHREKIDDTRAFPTSTRNKHDIPIFGLGILFFLTFLMVPILIPESNTNLTMTLRFAAATFYGKSVTDLGQDIIGLRAMVTHENAYPILNGLNSTHLPTTFLFVAPIAFLPWNHANLAWAFLMLPAMFCIFRLLGLTWLQTIGFGCLSILWPPVMLSFGQFTILWLLLVLLAYRTRNKNPLASGIFIGIATLIKLFPAVMLIPFVLQKKWSALYGLVLVIVFGVGTAFLISPESIYKYLSLQENIRTIILRSDNSSLLNVGYRWLGVPGLILAIFLLATFLLLNRKQLGIRETAIEERSWMVWTFLSVALLPVVWTYSLVPLLPVVFQFLLSKNTIVKCLGWAALIIPIGILLWVNGNVPCIASTTLLIGIGITIAGNIS